MENPKISTLKASILEGMKKSSAKLIEQKILLKQKVAISKNGKISLISPKKV